jgi:HAD superfamily hydrolase (TIGR01549 family)
MAHPIEAVLFDMGGTLRSTIKRSRDERLKFVAEILKLLDSDADPAKLSRLLARRAAAYRRWARETMVELNEADLWSRWILPDWPEAQVREHAVQLNLLWRDATGERVIYPETAEVVLELFRRGYRLGLVSNTTSSIEAPDALKKQGIAGCFETMILSAVVGKRKPDPEILLEATSRMGIQPDRCAYIGDLPHRDVAAARQAGFSKTVLIHDCSSQRIQPIEDPRLEPDHHIDNLRELLEIFPPRTPPKPSPVYAVSISTMWAMKNFDLLGDFMEAARRIGFSQIELNHQVDSAMLDGVNLDRYQFSSVHEPCPADIPVGMLKKRDWLISAIDEECRHEGVKSVQRSIDLAHRLGAATVVVHAGAVDLDRSLENRMRVLFESGQPTSKEYREVKDLLVTRRKELASPRLEAVKKSLVELLDYAGQYKVRLGLENRYYYLEFPNPDELKGLLDLAGPDRLGFIYDVGHAQALSRLGFFPLDEWLKRFAPRIIGTHLHDVSGIRDHLAAGLGDVDFDLIAGFLPDKAFRTCEFLGSNTPEQVRNGLKFLQEHGCINYQ